MLLRGSEKCYMFACPVLVPGNIPGLCTANIHMGHARASMLNTTHRLSGPAWQERQDQRTGRNTQGDKRKNSRDKTHATDTLAGRSLLGGDDC